MQPRDKDTTLRSVQASALHSYEGLRGASYFYLTAGPRRQSILAPLLMRYSFPENHIQVLLNRTKADRNGQFKRNE